MSNRFNQSAGVFFLYQISQQGDKEIIAQV